MQNSNTFIVTTHIIHKYSGKVSPHVLCGEHRDRWERHGGLLPRIEAVVWNFQ